MLPVRIELTTSPLPRECSTTELRQRADAAKAACNNAANAACNNAAKAANSLDETAMLAIGGMPAQASGCNRGIAGRRWACFWFAMVSSGKTGKSGQSRKADARAARTARLAAALRENLKRRKQQARQRAAADKTAPGDTSAGDATARRDVPDFRRNQGGE